MEIHNRTNNMHIPLIVGRRVSQIVFLYTGETLSEYSQKGKYQNDIDIDILKNNWKPEDMLPKMYLDRENFA